jgi:uncharacterized RDD family membrane protein YckC
MKYVGFGPRLLAAIIDSILLNIVGFIIGMVLQMVMGKSGLTLAQVISLAINIYYIVFYQASTGQTLGKKAMGIKVVTLDGKKPSAGIFFLRDIVGKLVSAVILFIGFFMILWDGKKQGLHDKIASTVVVKA